MNTTKHKQNNMMRLRAATYNIHSCIDRNGQVAPDKTLDAIRSLRADLVALQEVDVGLPRTGGMNQARYLAENLGMNHIFCPTVRHKEGKYGLAIISRLPINSVRCRPLPGLRMFRFERRGALQVRVALNGRTLHVFNTHLSLMAPERRIQADALMDPSWLGFSASKAPTIFCADLNAGDRSPVYRRLAVHLRDVQRIANRPSAPRGTFTSRRPWLRLDHLFVSRHFQVVAVEVPRSRLLREASDHLPLCSDLRLEACTAAWGSSPK